MTKVLLPLGWLFGGPIIHRLFHNHVEKVESA